MLIGKILKPQGIKGEVKAESYLDRAEDFKNIRNVIIENTTYCIENCRLSGDYAYLKLKGVEDMNKAETLRNKELKIAEEERPKLPKGRFYISDLIGCEVFADETSLGKISEINQFGSADVYVIDDKISFPALKKAIKNIDIANKKILLIKEEFDKIAVYQE